MQSRVAGICTVLCVSRTSSSEGLVWLPVFFFVNTVFGLLKEGDGHLSYFNGYVHAVISYLMATSCWKREVCPYVQYLVCSCRDLTAASN